MSSHLIDTDWMIDVIHGQPAAEQTLTTLSEQGIAISLITYGELYQGAYYATDRVVAVAGLRKTLRGIRILRLSPRIMETFAIVRGQLPRHLRQQIGDMDLLIAATALTHNLTLLTRNVRDFQHIPGLQLYQPSAPTPSS